MEMIFGEGLVLSETGKKRGICPRMRSMVHSVRSEEYAQSQNRVTRFTYPRVLCDEQPPNGNALHMELNHRQEMIAMEWKEMAST